MAENIIVKMGRARLGLSFVAATFVCAGMVYMGVKIARVSTKTAQEKRKGYMLIFAGVGVWVIAGLWYYTMSRSNVGSTLALVI